MCILLGLVGEHHVKMDDFRWIWIWWLYWIQLCPWTVSLVEGFSRPREVVKPRRKAKNLVFGHPWIPPNSTTFVFLSSGYRKLKLSLEVYKQWGEANKNLQTVQLKPCILWNFPKKNRVACHFKHRNAGKPPWVFEKKIRLHWAIQRASDNNVKALAWNSGWVTTRFCLAWNGGCKTSWSMSCSQHFDKFIVLKKKLSTYDRAPNEGHPIWPLLRSQAKSHRAHNSQAAWVEGFSSIHPSIHHPGSSTSFLGYDCQYDCLEWSISTIFRLNQQDTPEQSNAFFL